MQLNRRELAAVLAGLRLYQQGKLPGPINTIATDGDQLNPLSDDEVDELCERINGAGRPAFLLHMEGGVIQDVTATEAADIFVIDYDTDGIDPDELTTVDQGGEISEEAVCGFLPVEESEECVRGRLRRYAATDGREC